MATLTRRFLVVAALFFWQGGFTFYSAVVVPLGQATFGPLEQGFLTGQVTNYLNLAGVIALVPLAWDAAAGRDVSPGRRAARWICWAILAVTMVGLLGLHVYLDRLLDPETVQVLERRPFRSGHRWYLWLSTIQWAVALVYVAVALASWRWEDGEGRKGAV